MTKTQEELQQLKAEYESLTTKLNELTEDEVKEVVGGVYYSTSKKRISYFHKGDCFINKKYPDVIGYVTHNQSAPASETDCINLDFYSASRREWSITPIFYYNFDLDDGIYVYHPEKNNPNYK